MPRMDRQELRETAVCAVIRAPRGLCFVPTSRYRRNRPRSAFPIAGKWLHALPPTADLVSAPEEVSRRSGSDGHVQNKGSGNVNDSPFDDPSSDDSVELGSESRGASTGAALCVGFDAISLARVSNLLAGAVISCEHVDSADAAIAHRTMMGNLMHQLALMADTAGVDSVTSRELLANQDDLVRRMVERSTNEAFRIVRFSGFAELFDGLQASHA